VRSPSRDAAPGVRQEGDWELCAWGLVMLGDSSAGWSRGGEAIHEAPRVGERSSPALNERRQLSLLGCPGRRPRVARRKRRHALLLAPPRGACVADPRQPARVPSENSFPALPVAPSSLEKSGGLLPARSGGCGRFLSCRMSFFSFKKYREI